MGQMIVKDRIWPALGYVPNKAQKRMHAARARHRVSAWGRRTGKSTGGGHELVPEAYRAYFNANALREVGKRAEYWIVGPNYSDSEKEFRVFWNDCRRLGFPFDHPGTYNDARSGSMTVSMWQGAFLVQAKSSAKPETLVGEGLNGVIMAEAAKMKESTWSKYVRPTLADFEGWSLFNSTPEGRNWFCDLWQQGQDPDNAEWWSDRFPSWINPHVYPRGANEEHLQRLLSALRSPGKRVDAKFLSGLDIDPEIIALARDLSEEMFNQEIAAKFSVYAGRVFQAWDEEVHVANLHYDPHYPVHIATDYGWTNPNVALFIQVDVLGNVNVLDEYYMRGRDITEFSSDLLSSRYQFLTNKATKLYPDPASPGDSAVLARDLKLGIVGNTGGLIKERLELIRQALKIPLQHLPFGHPERQPKLRVDRKCVEMIREMDAYRYPATKAEATINEPEAPLKKDDHTPETLGRFMRGYFGSPTSSGRPRQRKARVRG